MRKVMLILATVGSLLLASSVKADATFFDFDSIGTKVRLDDCQLVNDPAANKYSGSDDARLLIVDLTARATTKASSDDEEFFPDFVNVLSGPSDVNELNDNTTLSADFKAKYRPTMTMPKMKLNKNYHIRLLYTVYPQDDIQLKMGKNGQKKIMWLHHAKSHNGITTDKKAVMQEGVTVK